MPRLSDMLSNVVPPPGPSRVLALSQLIARTGDGAFYVCSALFFTRIIGFTPAQMGLGLTIGWSAALLLNVPLGNLADRTGPRRISIALFLLTAVALVLFMFASSLWMFVFVAIVYAVSQHGGSAAQQALLARVVPEHQIVESRAYVQASYNVGLSLGAALGALALLVDTRGAYLAAFALNAAAFVAGAIMLSRIPAVSPAPLHEVAERRRSVLRDPPYIVFSALNALLLLYNPLIDVVLPLWIIRYTTAPTWLLSLMLIFNTTIVVLMQVRVSRGVSGLTSARKYVRYGSFLLAAACVAFSSSSMNRSAWVASALLMTAVGVQTAGEMMQAAGSWKLSFGLAPEGRHGQYQAFYGNGFTVAEMIGPLALTGLIIYGGSLGWLVLGGVFIAAGAAMQPVVRWGERARDEALQTAGAIGALAGAEEGVEAI